MARKPQLTRNEAEHVRNKIKAMCRFSKQHEVAAKLGLSQQQVSAIVRGTSNPSRKTADLVLGVKSEKPSSVRCPHCDGTGRVQHSEGLQPHNEPGGRVRNEPVRARESNVLRVPRQRLVSDQLPMAPAPESQPEAAREKPVKRLTKSQLLEVNLQNKAREQVGLSPLKVRVYSCASGCGARFESTGSRFCAKCRNVSVTVLSGREVYE